MTQERVIPLMTFASTLHTFSEYVLIRICVVM